MAKTKTAPLASVPTSAPVAPAADGATKTRKPKAVGIARVLSLLERVRDSAELAGKLVKRYAAASDDEILAALVPEVEAITASSLSAVAGAEDLLERGWEPPASAKRAPSKKFEEGSEVSVKADALPRYAKAGIKSGDLLTVIGQGPVKGTLMCEHATTGVQMLMPKADVEQ